MGGTISMFLCLRRRIIGHFHGFNIAPTLETRDISLLRTSKKGIAGIRRHFLRVFSLDLLSERGLVAYHVFVVTRPKGVGCNAPTPVT